MYLYITRKKTVLLFKCFKENNVGEYCILKNTVCPNDNICCILLGAIYFEDDALSEFSIRNSISRGSMCGHYLPMLYTEGSVS